MIIFVFCCVFQIVYQLVLVISIIKKKKSQIPSDVLELKSQISKSVSVIICAKNETENLRKNLPFILNQKYKDFEVIVVDDGSDDNTIEIIQQLKLTTNNLFLVTISKHEKIGLGKKYALQKGVENATKDLILLTDADCTPNSQNWISEMAALINEQHKIVLGISPYKYESSFLNAIVEYETAQTAMQYIGFAILGMPYMSVGRNVCYDAKLLKSKVWNKNELAIASGDDDLALQSLATKCNVTVCLKEDSYTYSLAKKGWKSWFQQKTRHAESGFLYKFKYKLLLGSYILTKIGFYLSVFLIFCMLNKINIVYLTLVVATMAITSIANMLIHITLNIQQRWNYTLILDPIYGTMPLLTGLLNLFQSNRKWK